MGLGQLHGEGNGKENDAIQSEYQHGEEDVIARAEEIGEAAAESRAEKGGDPNLRDEGDGHTDVTDAAAESALQKREFDPGGDAR